MATRSSVAGGIRRTVGIGLVGMLAVVAAACGDDGDGDATSNGADSAAGNESDSAAGNDTGSAAGPVTIEHIYGSTTLDARPERIVSLDTQWTDVLTALDAPLVGAGLLAEAGGEPFPWQEIPDDVELLVADTIPFEGVAALEPDLIVITFGAVEETDYEQLSEIAPTIPLLGDAQVDPWQDIAAVAGEILGVPDEAARLVTEAEERNAEVKAELPGLEGMTFAFANYVPGDAIYVLTDPADGANLFFAQLGLEIDPDLLSEAAEGRLELSLENLGQLDADVLMLLTNGADTADISGYDQLPAVRAGAAGVVDMATAVALNTPTPLSLPYALERIRPVLTAAAG